MQPPTVGFPHASTLPATRFLGLDLHKESGKVIVNQPEFIKKILTKFRMEFCNPTFNPMDPGTRFTSFPQCRQHPKRRRTTWQMCPIAIEKLSDVCSISPSRGGLTFHSPSVKSQNSVRIQDVLTRTQQRKLLHICLELSNTASYFKRRKHLP